MRFYRIEFCSDRNGSSGFSFFASRREAEHAKRQWIDEHADGGGYAVLYPIEVEPTKAGILAALNRLAAHPDNG